VFIDIDDTIIHQVRDGISYRNFSLWVYNKLFAGECTQEQAKQALTWSSTTFPTFPHEGETTLATCKKLQDFVHAYLYLTARNNITPLDRLTEEHLENFPEGLKIAGHAPNGVYFTNHGCKAAAILLLNASSNEINSSNTFVLIDDNIRYIRAVAEKCAHLGKKIICIHYNPVRSEHPPSDEEVNLVLAKDGFAPFPDGLEEFWISFKIKYFLQPLTLE
jgi:hypothetical protein